MKKTEFKITLGETMPTMVSSSAKHDPIACVVERVCTVIHLRLNEALNVNVYNYLMLKKPQISGNFHPFTFEIEAKNDIRRWQVFSGDNLIPLEKLAQLYIYVKTDCMSLGLMYQPQSKGITARPFWGMVSDDSRFQVLLQQIADKLISNTCK